MDFSLNDSQLELRARVLDFAGTELNQPTPSTDRNSVFDRENWRKCAEFGLLGGRVEESLGGKGWDTLTQVIALEALGYACRDNGLSLGINALVWTILEPILTFGSEAQKKKLIPDLISGRLLAADCVTEVNAGSDALNIQTTARKTEGGYVLDGEKRYIGFAPIADLLLVLAKTDNDAGPWGISAFLVNSSEKGVELSENTEKMGLRTLPMGEVSFTDCLVPESCRLGSEGTGMGMFNSTMEWERSFILCSFVGSMQYQLERAIEHARKRVQFGSAIGSFQSVSNRIADMRVRLETSRLLLYKCAWLKDRGEDAALESAMAKLHLSECCLESSLDSVRLHGAKGYLSEFDIERELRDSVGNLIYAGTSDIQRNLISRLLGL